jgi:protein SCO1/2
MRAEPHVYSGTVYNNPDPAPTFILTNDTGEIGSLDEYRGKVVLLYFGYTFCPDICPASLAELATALMTLDPADRDRVQVLMISVDPARDTPEVLRSYMDHFDPAFVGFTGSDDEIAEVAADYNVFYQAHEGTAATGYLVDHWAGTYLIDPEGRLVESFGFGTRGEDIAADVEEWL